LSVGHISLSNMGKNQTCTVDGCDRAVNARNMCGTHYGRWFNTGSVERVCRGCGTPVADGRTRFCSNECRPACVVDSCKGRAYSSAGHCSSHDRMLRRDGEIRPRKFTWSEPGGKCQICEKQLSEKARRKTCSHACSQRLSRHGGERPKKSECQGCGKQISLTERRPDGKLRRSDMKWCDNCLHVSVRRRIYRYGISPEQYAEAVAAGCEICGTTEAKLHVDHDHSCCPGNYTCGKCVRGFLCGSCNRAVGLLNENAETILAAADYVQRRSALK
jgi:hypothetical protein